MNQSQRPSAMSRSSSLSALLLCVAVAQLACGGPSIAPGKVDAGRIDHPNEGAAVGSSCTQASECDSPSTPECLSSIKPLASLAGVPADLANLGLVFPTGYCSSRLNCASDADCGAKGACYRPFSQVTAETLRDLEPPLGVSTGTLDFLPSYGVCLRTCTAVSECEASQLCEPPLADLVSLVPGAVNDTSYCVPDKSCPPEGCAAGPCNPNPCLNGGTCSVNGTAFTCACAEGYSGDTCQTHSQAPTRVIGQSCTSDSECNVVGTARCLSVLHPLEAVLPPTEFLATIGLDFSRGYCSNEPNCASDVQCGPHGRCLAPFRDVTADSLRDLEASFNPPLATGTLDYLGSYGACLRSCTDSADCFADQNCQLVMNDFISQVPGSTNTRTFCVPHPDCRYCSSNATCVVDANDHGACRCRPGFAGSGLVCAPTGQGACATSPCLNDGVCTDGDNGAYTCACPTGFSGTNCQLSSACMPNPCHNGGLCTAAGSSFTCNCATGFSGQTCDQTVSCPTLTAPDHAAVNVSSQAPGSMAIYECASGFTLVGGSTRVCQANGTWAGTAPTCVEDGSPCATAPCEHGGFCTADSDSTFSCSCAGTGYTGTTCATPVDCGALPGVANGAVTTDPVSSTTFGTRATVTCEQDYTLSGSAVRTCQANGLWSGQQPACTLQTIDPCTPNPCLNGGSCSTGGVGFTCSCAQGYSGTTCETPVDCGALAAPTDGAVVANPTTVGSTATYSCSMGFTLTGDMTRTCGASGAWSGTAPTCVASSCGQYTDVVYRVTAGFAIKGTSFNIGNQAFTGIVNNTSSPSWGSNGGSGDRSPFDRPPSSGTTTFTAGFVRLRYTNNAAGTPIAGTVRLVEWYVPLEFHQTAGATVDANVDHSVGIINNTLGNCGGGDAACANRTPGLSRSCAANATGTLSGTTLNWGACTATSGDNAWNWAKARAVTGAGCATGWNAFGNTKSSSGLVPAAGKGDAYQTWNQTLKPFTFSGSNPLTATFTMPEMQIPNGTGASNTWMQITTSSVISTQCGSTPGTDLVCDVQ